MADYADARTRLATDVRIMMADTEELLKAGGADSKEKIASVRPRLEATVARAKTQLTEMEGAMEEHASWRERPMPMSMRIHGAPPG
jgi:ElaB/YqjD/DUF883 family membrane-anchored ribosome-binding protein